MNFSPPFYIKWRALFPIKCHLLLMPSESFLRVENLSKRFGDFIALNDINLEIKEGEFLTIVGPSGSGKSTLIRIIVGIDEPTAGKIWLRGKSIEKIPANLRPTCMVFQSLALFPHKSVGENIEFPLKLRGENKNRIKERVLELLDLLDLPDNFYNKRINQCSGGEQQRIALARALAFDPEILFFDEPLSALDFRLRKKLEKELKDLHQRTGKTFVYITHSLEEAMVMSDRIAIMNQGQFEQIAETDEIYVKPKSKFVAEFMGEVNLFDVTGCKTNGIKGKGLEINLKINRGNLEFKLTEKAEGTLMVRPESIRFLKKNEKSDFIVNGIIQAEYDLGSRTQYKVITLGGKEMAIEKLREDRYRGQINDEVRIGWDYEQTHTF